MRRGQFILDHDHDMGQEAVVLDRPAAGVVAQVGREPGDHRGGTARRSHSRKQARSPSAVRSSA